jgi:trans-aconitate methyltransferase
VDDQSTEKRMTDWNADLYDDKHSFVWKLASSVMELLAPQPRERILDIGCGTGQLSAEIAESGAKVVGLDSSPAMIAEARRLYPQVEFVEQDAHDFDLSVRFDAVFSNAALHWISDPPRVIGCVARALNPGGRLVVEFGGDGNVVHLVHAIENAFDAVIGSSRTHPWYFPSIAEFAGVLQTHNIEVTQAALIDRPTPLEGEHGLRNWVRMFGGHWLAQIPAEKQEAFLIQVEAIARDTLYRNGSWFADYRRIRVVGQKRENRGGKR